MKKDDIELLNLCAKACSVKLEWVEDENGDTGDYWDNPRLVEGFSTRHWNPLVSEEDAFRVAIAQNMIVNINAAEGLTTVSTNKINGLSVNVEHNNDKFAATMRAITLCLAEIGRRA